MVKRSKTVRIDTELLERIKKIDPILANIGSDSEVVQTVLRIFLKYNERIKEIIKH